MPACKRGEGGLAPAVLVAETPDGDYAFLDLPTAAFDLTDRGVKGRTARRVPSTPSPTPTAASIAPARQVHLAALARDRTGQGLRAFPSPSSSRAPTASSTRA